MSLSTSVINEITGKLLESPDEEFSLKLGDGRTVYGFRGHMAEKRAQKAHELAIMPISGVEEIVSGTYVFLA